MINAFTKILKNTALFSFIKVLFLIGTLSYLCFKLITFEAYNDLFNNFRHLSLIQCMAIGAAIFLLPINLMLEALKWQRLVARTMHLSTKQAIKAILVGYSTGFNTPNRIGEMLGRMLYVKKEYRKITAFYAFINSLTQNLIICFLGIPAALYFFINTDDNSLYTFRSYLFIASFIVTVMFIAYMLFPQFLKNKQIQSIFPFLTDIQHLSLKKLIEICGLTFIRFVVFCLQLYFMLHFFSVDITFQNALIAIPASYLFITITPSMAFSEASIRSSFAVFFIGAYSSNIAGIAFAGLTLWLLNFGVPMLVGLKIIAYTK